MEIKTINKKKFRKLRNRKNGNALVKEKIKYQTGQTLIHQSVDIVKRYMKLQT